MAEKITRVWIDRDLAGEAMRILRVKSRTEAVRVALMRAVGLERSERLTEGAAEVPNSQAAS